MIALWAIAVYLVQPAEEKVKKLYVIKGIYKNGVQSIVAIYRCIWFM